MQLQCYSFITVSKAIYNKDGNEGKYMDQVLIIITKYNLLQYRLIIHIYLTSVMYIEKINNTKLHERKQHLEDVLLQKYMSWDPFYGICYGPLKE